MTARPKRRNYSLGFGMTAMRGLDDEALVEEAVANLVEDRALVFRDLLDSQPDVARRLLPIIARRKVVKCPTSAAFLAEARLSASSVRSALADLVARDIVYRSPDGIQVYERLFAEWLRKQGKQG